MSSFLPKPTIRMFSQKTERILGSARSKIALPKEFKN
jgi:hypothetical protein